VRGWMLLSIEYIRIIFNLLYVLFIVMQVSEPCGLKLLLLFYRETDSLLHLKLNKFPECLHSLSCLKINVIEIN
jgi:hypothetical protein